MGERRIKLAGSFRIAGDSTAGPEPDGHAIAPTSNPQPGGTLVKALARAGRWQKVLDEGQFASVRDLAEAERVGLSYISRILRLNLLAPDIVERVMPTAGLARFLEPFPVEWEKQRNRLL